MLRWEPELCKDLDARMSDDGRAKRLKTAAASEDGTAAAAEVAELRRRNAELESENEKLRQLPERLDSQIEQLRQLRGENTELESENEQLRRRVHQLEGSHEVLPVTVPPATVDLSRVDTSLVTQISSFLGTSRELFSLALTCKSFGRRQPTSGLSWSLADEVARQAVCSSATDAEMSRLPQYVIGSTATWLSVLHSFEHPLFFDVLLGGYIGHRSGDESKVHGTDGDYHCTAVSSTYALTSGVHYAEFQITGSPCIGIVRPMPSLDPDEYVDECYFIGDEDWYPDFLAQRSDSWSDGDVHACDYFSRTGRMSWTNWDDETHSLNWDGMEVCESGDTIGMLLNLDDGTLTVYKNNRRLGVMKDGLSGSYCWYATVAGYDSVAIRRGSSPAQDNDAHVNGSNGQA